MNLTERTQKFFTGNLTLEDALPTQMPAYVNSFVYLFGPLSSIFDYLTFGVLLFILHAGPSEFRTGWFIESVTSASMIVLIIRTKRPFFKSKPSRYLLAATLIVGAVTVILPYTRFSKLFSFILIPPVFLIALAVILALYVAGAEIVKRVFYKRVAF